MKTSRFSNMFIAFILALGVAGVVYFLQSRPVVISEDKDKDLTKILVAKFDLKPGERINIDRFKWVGWPDGSIQDDYYTEQEVKALKGIHGMVVRYEILEGEPLKKADLVGGDTKSILSAFISPNMKAVSVPLKKVANAGVHVTPSDYIDIILPQRKGQTQSVDTILNAIKVIAVDDNFFIPDGDTPNTIAKNITLEVTTEQAEALALSIAHGGIVISYNSAYTPKLEAKSGVKKLVKSRKIKVNRGNFD